VTASGQYAGGLVGVTYQTTITNSYAAGSVTATNGNAGGILGGINGTGYVTIQNSFAAGVAAGGSNKGGLIGSVTGSGNSFTNNWWYNGTNTVGIGTGELDGVTKAASATAFFNPCHAVYSGWDFDVDGVSAGHNGTWIMAGLPHLQMEWSTAITNAAQLQMMALDLDASYTLANDINAADTVNWNAGLGFEPVGNSSTKFTGNFNGNSKTVTNLSIERNTNYLGLFGYTDGAELSNLGLLSVTVKGSDGSTCIGGLVGANSQSTINNSYSTGTVSGGGNSEAIGGLVGANSSSAINNAYFTGSVLAGSGSNYIGGLVGMNDNSSTITNSYSTGTVSGDASSQSIGGLVGYNNGWFFRIKC